MRAAGAATALTASSWSRVLGANDRVQMGAIGVGERGRFVLEEFSKQPDLDVRAVCDVWNTQIDEAQQITPGAKGYRDYRTMIESEGLSVSIVILRSDNRLPRFIRGPATAPRPSPPPAPASTRCRTRSSSGDRAT